MEYKETDLPHSDAGHNPFWCQGNGDGWSASGDPCWSCIAWAFGELEELYPNRAVKFEGTIIDPGGPMDGVKVIG